LISIVQGLDSGELNDKAHPDMWSVGQICEHLMLTEMLFCKSIEAGLKSGDYVVPDKDISILEDRSKRYVAPSIATPSERSVEAEDVVARLKRTRAQLLKVVDGQADKTVFGRRAAKHPLFQELRLDQWLDLLDLHEQRHIRQIQDLLDVR